MRRSTLAITRLVIFISVSIFGMHAAPNGNLQLIAGQDIANKSFFLPMTNEAVNRL